MKAQDYKTSKNVTLGTLIFQNKISQYLLLFRYEMYSFLKGMANGK